MTIDFNDEDSEESSTKENLQFSISKSKWVKDMSTRMRVFNIQIFEVIYERYSKDNKEWHDEYLQKSYDNLMVKAYNDENISNDEFFKFCNNYELNLEKLKKKELTDRKAFPKNK